MEEGIGIAYLKALLQNSLEGISKKVSVIVDCLPALLKDFCHQR
jgi:hypothetical protein